EPIELFIGEPAAQLRAPPAEAARIDSTLEWTGVTPCGGHEIDGAAQSAGAETQRVRAFVYLGVAVGRGIYPLKIRAAVGVVQRHTVLIQGYASQVIVAVQARTAYGQARI